MELVEPGQELLVVTENGYGKRTPVEDYKIQVRGGKGLLTYDKSKFKKTGALIGAMVVDEDDEALMINSEGIIIRIRAGEVSKLGRATQGVKIMKVEESFSSLIARTPPAILPMLLTSSSEKQIHLPFLVTMITLLLPVVSLIPINWSSSFKLIAIRPMKNCSWVL